MHRRLCFMVKCCARHIHTRGEAPPRHVHDGAFGSGRRGEGRASPPCHGARWLARGGAMEHQTVWGERRPSVPMDGGGAGTTSSWKPTRIGPWKAIRAAQSVCTGRLGAISIQRSTGRRWAQHASVPNPVRGFGSWLPTAQPMRPGVSRVEVKLLGSTHLLGCIQPLLLVSSCHHLERILAVWADGVGRAVVGFSPYCSLRRGMRNDHRRCTLRPNKAHLS